jgi:hypothetical protein
MVAGSVSIADPGKGVWAPLRRRQGSAHSGAGPSGGSGDKKAEIEGVEAHRLGIWLASARLSYHEFLGNATGMRWRGVSTRIVLALEADHDQPIEDART